MKHNKLPHVNFAHRIDVITKNRFSVVLITLLTSYAFKSSNKPAYSRTHFFLSAKENGYIMRSHNLFKLGNSTEEAIPDVIFCEKRVHVLFIVRCYLSKVKESTFKSFNNWSFILGLKDEFTSELYILKWHGRKRSLQLSCPLHWVAQ